MPLRTMAMLMVWLAAVIAGGWTMTRYQWQRAATATAARSWPQGCTLTRDEERPTLVMFVHPHCPCTQASLHELTVILTRCRDEFAARLVFVRPPGFEAPWEQSDLWRTAQTLPGVEVRVDPAGKLARSFGARVSGETFLYDAEGHLLFHGGITAARGHQGDNAGRDAIISLVESGTADATHGDVYGCELLDG